MIACGGGVPRGGLSTKAGDSSWVSGQVTGYWVDTGTECRYCRSAPARGVECERRWHGTGLVDREWAEMAEAEATI